MMPIVQRHLIPSILRLMALGLAVGVHAESSAADWERLPPLPSPNGGFACGVSARKIVIVGGTLWKDDIKHWLRAVHSYDPKTRKWAELPGLSEALAYGVVCQKQTSDGASSFSTLGGSNGTHVRKNLITPDGRPPIPLPELPDELVLCAGGVIDDARIFVGGTNDTSNLAGCVNSAHLVRIANYNWRVTKLPDYPGRPFCTAASAVAGDELFIFGGANWDDSAKAVTNTAEAYAFSPKHNTWRKLKPYPFAARGVTSVALDDHHLYLAGGYGGSPEKFFAEAFIYDTISDSYAKATPLPYAALVTLLKHEGWLYCLGGEDMKKHRVDAFWRISLGDVKKL